MPEPALRGERRDEGEPKVAVLTSPAAWIAAAWPNSALDNPHSRRVALLKRVLPAIGLALLLLIAVWPRLAPVWERIRLNFPVIDLREARQLRMLDPRYAGIDRLGPSVCRYRRGRPAGARSAGSDVAGGAAGRYENAWRCRHCRYRRDRDLPVADAAPRSVRRGDAGASERHPLCHRYRAGRCRQQRGGGDRPGRGTWPVRRCQGPGLPYPRQGRHDHLYRQVRFAAQARQAGNREERAGSPAGPDCGDCSARRGRGEAGARRGGDGSTGAPAKQRAAGHADNRHPHPGHRPLPAKPTPGKKA